jgi:hypothetical protein
MLLACLLPLGLVAGCSGGEDSPSASSSSSASASGDATGSPSEGSGSAGSESSGAVDTDAPPPFNANTDPDAQQQSEDSFATVTNIRLGRQDGFDRVVFEIGGKGTPGWNVFYTDEAAAQGSGEPIDVSGDAILQVTMQGMGLPFETGAEEWSGPDPLKSGDTKNVTEVAWDGTFEGTTVAFVGLTGKKAFRVYSLANPTRIVLDVAD